MKNSDNKDFVDQLMNRAFNFKAPPMPNFKKMTRDTEVVELDFNQLSYLNAAGSATPNLVEMMKNNQDLPPTTKK